MSDSSSGQGYVPGPDSAEAADAANPASAASRLAQIVNDYPTLQATVAANPAASPELLDWLASYGTVAARQAVAARRAGTLPAGNAPAAGGAGIPAAPQYPVAPPASQQGGFVPPMRQGTDGFALAALIFGIVGMPLFGWIFGGMALSRIARNHTQGRGMAIVGIVLATVWFIVGLVVVIPRMREMGLL